MKTGEKVDRTIWVKEGDSKTIQVIDQRHLPHRLVIEDLTTEEAVARAIKEMHVRGAPLIGVAAAFGMYLAALEAPSDDGFESHLKRAGARLVETRPTGVNLERAVKRQLDRVKGTSASQRIRIAYDTARQIAEEEVQICKRIGELGVNMIETLSRKKKGAPIRILTHCNAGWLACVQWGTATSPIYHAFDRNIAVDVWVNETRPRNQGASLTAWELGQRGVPHKVIVDNAAGHLMQRGLVDLVLVGTDRTTATGDVANKIGTYMMALAAKENGIPFYVALPSSSIDWNLKDGIKEIPIEERSSEEVTAIQGLSEGEVKKVRLVPEATEAVNYAFDVTPRRFVTGLITERGIAEPSARGLLKLFPEKKGSSLRLT